MSYCVVQGILLLTEITMSSSFQVYTNGCQERQSIVRIARNIKWYEDLSQVTIVSGLRGIRQDLMNVIILDLVPEK